MNEPNTLEQGTKLMLDYAKLNGLVPVVAQNASTGQILMLAYANREAVDETIQTGFATFWSRSRNKLWTKGEESGNRLKVKEILTDCDQDSLVYLVEMENVGACHTKYEDGTARTSCFYRKFEPDAGSLSFLPRSRLDRKSSGIGEVLEREYAQIEDRYKNPKEGSATTRMFQRPSGVERKILEEAGEVTWASIGGESIVRQISELADLMYAEIAYMVRYGMRLAQLGEEMGRRQK